MISTAGNTIITGDEAKNFDAIRLDSFAPANLGTLVEANEGTGLVRWKAVDGSLSSATLGPHTIRIMKKSGYGR